MQLSAARGRARRRALRPAAVPATEAGSGWHRKPGATSTVLMVMYHFPPIGGVSMARNVHTSRYLPDHGWTPVVLGARTSGDLVDTDASALVPPTIEVTRAGARDRQRWRLRSGSCDGPLPRGANAGTPDRRPRSTRRSRRRTPPPARSSPGRLPPSGHRVSPVSGACCSFRTARSGGCRSPSGRGCVRQDRDGLMPSIDCRRRPPTSSPERSAGSTGAAWVAEFRDPWVGNPVAEPLPWLHRRLRARLERLIVESADRLVFLSPTTARAYARRYAAGAQDRGDHERPRSAEGGRGWRHGAAARSLPDRLDGVLYRPSELRLVLQALANLIARRPTLPDRAPGDVLR